MKKIFLFRKLKVSETKERGSGKLGVSPYRKTGSSAESGTTARNRGFLENIMPSEARLMFFIIFILVAFAFVFPSRTKADVGSFTAALIKLVEAVFPQEPLSPVQPMEPGQQAGPGQPTEPGQPGPEFTPKEEEQEEFVDPREVQQVLREISNQKRELNRFAKQLKKMKNNTDDLNQVNSLLEQVNNFENSIRSSADRDSLQEFRDAQIWEEINKIRAKIELPKELSQWKKDIKRVEKMASQKKFKNLGFDLEQLKSRVAEIKNLLSEVEGLYNSGNLEEAMENFDDLRQDLHPGEIMNVMQRIQEITNNLKPIKDTEIKNKIKEAFSEVITSFNEGDYRVARETLEESFSEIMKIIRTAYPGLKKGYNKQQLYNMTEKLEERLKDKADEKKAKIQERKEEKPVEVLLSPLPPLPETPSAATP